VSTDTFQLVKQLETSPLPTAQYRVPFSRIKIAFKGAYAMGEWLEDSTYTKNYYYAKSRVLTASSRADCHVIIRSAADDFTGLFLVLTPSGKSSLNVYLSGCLGSSGSSDGVFHEAPITEGYILSDSVVVTKTGSTAYAFRGSGHRSYTDTVTKVFHIDYHTGRVALYQRDSIRTALTSYFD
jgi:hypothetical protein